MDDETFEQLCALMRLAREHRLLEISIESTWGAVRVRRDRQRRAANGGLRADAPPSARVEEIRAPLVGIFYHSPAPDAPPYVTVGDWIEPGQTVGLIEAMKVFSEITCELEGRVVAITAGNGELVEAGQPLIIVELPE
jgi:biotin carboxyl carrier protein